MINFPRWFFTRTLFEWYFLISRSERIMWVVAVARRCVRWWWFFFISEMKNNNLFLIFPLKLYNRAGDKYDSLSFIWNSWADGLGEGIWDETTTQSLQLTKMLAQCVGQSDDKSYHKNANARNIYDFHEPVPTRPLQCPSEKISYLILLPSVRPLGNARGENRKSWDVIAISFNTRCGRNSHHRKTISN